MSYGLSERIYPTINEGVLTEQTRKPEEAGIIPGERLGEPAPLGHLVSNGQYTVMVTAAGTGFSECSGQALTRWDGDPIQDCNGMFFYLRDLDRSHFWSAGHQPVQSRPDQYEARFTDGRATIARLDDGIETTMEITVTPGSTSELRRLTLRNTSDVARRIEVTSCMEVVLNQREADAAHPGFSKLFVQTEWVPQSRMLLARRRPRSSDEQPKWLYHWMIPAIQDAESGIEFESSRVQFLGRGRCLARPKALVTSEPLSGSIGNVLDPILALRCVLHLQPGESSVVTFGTGYAEHREQALRIGERYSTGEPVEQAFQDSASDAQQQRERLGISIEEGRILSQTAVDLLYDRRFRFCGLSPQRPGTVLPEIEHLLAGPADLPLILVMFSGASETRMAQQVQRARSFWSLMRVHTRIALLGSKSAGDGKVIESAWTWLFDDPMEGQGREEIGAFIDQDVLTPDELISLVRHAHLLLDDSFPEAVYRPGYGSIGGDHAYRPFRAIHEPADGQDLRVASQDTAPFLDNGRGGFSADGREYIIRVYPLPDGHPDLPPMPWSNVIANERFGFITTERGPSTTWGGNSRLHRVTPWFNDPIGDPLSEAIFLRDEESREFWSLTPGTVDSGTPFTVRHGFGYTSWESRTNGLEQEITTFVPRHDPLKLTRVRVHNTGALRRVISLIWYAQLVLGDSASRMAGLVDTKQDSGSLFAWSIEPGVLSGQVAFASVTPSASVLSFSTDRGSFLGRMGSLESPRAVVDLDQLDNMAGPGMDPCFAFQVKVELEPGEGQEFFIALGEAGSREEAQRYIQAYDNPIANYAALAEVEAFWEETLTRMHIQTPEPALDLMVNGWLPYQNLSCRMWGRTAYYQSGGAFGFRDQLQDSAALIYLLPDLTRRQILLHAAHQFVEGDVLHWWHPPADHGIRTRFSDDLLWLPYVTGFYIQSTGDWDILGEDVPYRTARLLRPEEDEAFLVSEESTERGDLYEHCCRALDRSLQRTGIHGLPLMGSGDWNDGMNRVGRGGQGESVWMGFFLYTILEGFLPICLRRGDVLRASRYQERMQQVAQALDESGWDGEWYRRAYYDDGTPLGSASNEECRIDCLAQAWAVISKAVPEARARLAMQAVEKYLVDDGAGMIRLLTPAFDTCEHDPGYIKGYIPGVRENGGQYTHGALWAVKATAQLGDTSRAAELLTMMSPVSHGSTPEQVALYQTEPYVVAADVYGVGTLTGRGGWTWYTGSAGWMYRVAIEDVLGFHLLGGHSIRFCPNLPKQWDQASLNYRFPDAQGSCEIHIERDSSRVGSILSATLDGNVLLPDGQNIQVPLLRDGRTHLVQIMVGA